MKVTAIIKGRIDQNGHRPIQIRIYHEGKNTYRPTNIRIDPKHFEKGRVKGHPKSRELNEIISTKIIQIQAHVLNGQEKKKARINFYQFFETVKAGVKRKPGTLRQY